MLILDSCSQSLQMCCDMRPFLKIVYLIIKIVQFTVPAVLIILGSIDLFKAMTKNDEKSSSDLSKKFGKRVMYGVIIFLVPILVEYILRFVEASFKTDADGELPGVTAWIGCWNNIKENNYCSSKGCDDIYEKNDINPSNGATNTNNNSSDSSSNNNTTPNMKTCYMWMSASCEDDDALVNMRNNPAIEGLRSVSSTRNVNNRCEVTLNLDNVDMEAYVQCNNLCSTFGGTIISNNANTKTCNCSFSRTNRKNFSERKPSSAVNGIVNRYECEQTTNCNDAESFCTRDSVVETVKEQ